MAIYKLFGTEHPEDPQGKASSPNPYPSNEPTDRAFLLLSQLKSFLLLRLIFLALAVFVATVSISLFFFGLVFLLLSLVLLRKASALNAAFSMLWNCFKLSFALATGFGVATLYPLLGIATIYAYFLLNGPGFLHASDFGAIQQRLFALLQQIRQR